MPSSRDTVAAVTALLITLVSSAHAAPSATSDCDAPYYPPEAEPYGSSYVEWAVRYQQWLMGFPSTANPAADNAPPESNQSGRVWYLATVTGSRSVTRHMTVPSHTALFFSALSIRVNNKECPTDTTFTTPELITKSEELWSTALTASVTIDGEAIDGFEDLQTSPFLVQTDGFPATLADHDNLQAAGGLTCVPDGITIDPNVARGVYLMVKPLSLGHHTIRIVGIAGPEDAPAFEKDVTYEIEVVRRH
ncbi:MAG TPA: hypothetical protein VMF89_16990 [Polyangiales bacterium]|nr:hypothetical protein [Polyangiales bacterium]